MCAQRITNTTLLDGNVTCDGAMVIFTCETVGSDGLAWSSEQYIGPGGKEILVVASDISSTNPRKRTDFNPNTYAILTRITTENNGQRKLTSELHIIASASRSPDSSVICKHTNDDQTATIQFQVFGKK